MEYDLDYTDSSCIRTETSNQTCAEFLRAQNFTGVSCTCNSRFRLTQAFVVCLEIDLKRSMERVMIDTFRVMSSSTTVWSIFIRIIVVMFDHVMIINWWAKLKPLQRHVNHFEERAATLLSAMHHVELLQIHYSMVWSPLFSLSLSRSPSSDSFTLIFNENQNVTWINTGIAWSTDKEVKFQNPPNPETCNDDLSSTLSTKNSLSRWFSFLEQCSSTLLERKCLEFKSIKSNKSRL